MISAGRLTWRATMLSASSSQDALGLRTDAFTSGASFPCDLRNQSATEQNYADGVAIRATWEVRARWRRIANIGLSAVDRLSVDGRTLRINSIVDLEGAHRVAVIQCEEVS